MRARPRPPALDLERLAEFAARARRARARHAPEGLDVPDVRDMPRPRTFSVFGCLGRLATLVLFALLVLGALLFGLLGASGGARDWLVDVGQQFGVVTGMPAQTQRGIDAYRAGDLLTAERELSEAARAYPRSGLALVYLARIRLDRGDDTRAREHLREAVAREPDNAVAHRELAGVHLTRARQLRARAASDVAVADELVSAERHFTRALALSPSDRRARGYYACVLADMGRDDEARQALAQAGDGPWASCVADPAGVEEERS